MATIFSRIIAGEIPAFKIKENERFLAFLDIRPLTYGHTLVIPKIEEDYIFDLTDEDYTDLFLFAKSVSQLLRSKITCERIGMSVVGLEVPHAHIHLIPINSIKDMNFEKPNKNIGLDDLKKMHSLLTGN